MNRFKYLVATLALTLMCFWATAQQQPLPVLLNLSMQPTTVVTTISGKQVAGVYFQLGFRNNQLVVAQSDTSLAYPFRQVLDLWYNYWLNNQLKIASSSQLQFIINLPAPSQQAFASLQPILQVYERMFNGIGSGFRLNFWLQQYANNIMRPAPTYVSAIVPASSGLDSLQQKRVYAFWTNSVRHTAQTDRRPQIVTTVPADTVLAGLISRPTLQNKVLYLISYNQRAIPSLAATAPVIDTVTSFVPKRRGDTPGSPVKNLIIFTLSPTQGALPTVATSKAVGLVQSSAVVTQYKSAAAFIHSQLVQAFKPYSIQSAVLDYDRQPRPDSLVNTLSHLQKQKAGFYFNVKSAHPQALERILPLLLKFADADGQTLVVCNIEDPGTSTCLTFAYGPSSQVVGGAVNLSMYITKIKNALLSARHSYNSGS